MDAAKTKASTQEFVKALNALIKCNQHPELLIWSSVKHEHRVVHPHLALDGPVADFDANETNLEEITQYFAEIRQPRETTGQSVVVFIQGETAFSSQQESLLAQVRDQTSLPVILLILIDSLSRKRIAKRMMALGFQKRNDLTSQSLAAFQFDINSYKQTPDWLNPRQWANPERWDKHRW